MASGLTSTLPLGLRSCLSTPKLSSKETNKVYIVTITLQDGRSIIQGVYYDVKRAEAEQARLQRNVDDYQVYVTETKIID